MRHRLLLAVAMLAIVAGCSKPTDKTAAAPAAPHAEIGAFGLDATAMDKAVKPGDDFFAYVNGTWLATFKIPADKARFGTFDKLSDKSNEDLKSLIEDLQKSPQAEGSNAKKVADLYAAWMDEAGIEKRGVEPLKPFLAEFAAVKTKADLMKEFGKPYVTAPFGVGVFPDLHDTSKYTVGVAQDGLGMPNRDFYLKEGDRYTAYRAAYKTFVTKLLTLIGDSAPEKSAEAIIKLETDLAKVQWDPARQRDVKATDNPMNRAGLAKLAPTVDWNVVLDSLGVPKEQGLNVSETTAVRDGAKLIDTVSIETWKKYITFHFVRANASYLPKAFDDANFEFYSKTLSGVETQKDRWKRGVGLVDRQIGEAMGQLYVEKHFPPETKKKMDDLVANLRAALKSRIETLSWMDEPTRAEALKKLATFEPRVGYPAKWIDYSTLTIEPGKLFESVQATQKFGWKRQIDHLKGPVDRGEWEMTPPTINAYYNPLMNQITFPAGILQPPFFDANADPAVNYGAIGAVIGHEIGHGFDDQGREFDEKGQIRDWWTKHTAEKFKASTDNLAAQYGEFCPLASEPKTCVNGRLTMGENIGDLGGIQMALTAYHNSLGGKPAPVIDGLTGDQRFFLAYGQAWRSMQRDDETRRRILSDPHSPPKYRVNGIVRNVDAWYEAFGVKEGDKLYIAPEKRVHIW